MYRLYFMPALGSLFPILVSPTRKETVLPHWMTDAANDVADTVRRTGGHYKVTTAQAETLARRAGLTLH